MRARELIMSAVAIAAVVGIGTVSYGDGGLDDGGFDSGLPPPDSGQTTCSENDFPMCAPNGGFGCAGQGGFGGGGGQGGGASIALFASGNTTTVNVTNGAFFPVQGGPGGPGAGGGQGASGDAGFSSPSQMCFSSCEAGCVNNPLAGGSGGPGGSGGSGGMGGGGAGGPTYFYAAENGAVITASQSTLDASAFLDPASAGGLQNGPDGVEAVHP